ncbi:putative bifunctional diguanylate cyclase/phosphodiesterase [Rheinheimera sp.]|uniref:putative bifunctional diguanylate cyclase/phosphodiesterase n=1 Tax=Rheinheimera sp. TaxID=1869214 RepID=UPI002FDCC3DA
MSTELILARLSLFLIQAGLALVLSLVLWHFYRIYQRHYLKSWSVAFFVLALYVISLSCYSYFATELASAIYVRQFFEFTYIFTCYAFAIWVLVGVREAVTSERIASRTVNQLLWLVGLIALFSVLLFAFDTQLSPWKHYLQVNLRLFFIGAALFVAGIWLFSLQRKIFVTKLVASSIVLWGFQLVVVAMLSVWFGTGDTLNRVILVSKHLELFCQTILGLGLIIWLQEDERTANLQLTAKTRYLDSHDHLTGALNRDALLQELNLLMQQQQEPLLLVMVGLDRFKTINESVGLKQGDRILREVNRRFEASILKPRFIARTGGDIFALVLTEAHSEKQRQFSLQHIEQQIEKPFAFENVQLKMTASMGLAMYPEHAANAETLLQKANIAFHQAKRQQQRWVQYHSGMEEESARLLLLEKELLQAIEQRQFVLYFQPQWNLREQRIDAFEALVRWQHPERGLLMPAQFLPAAAQLGLSQRLDLALLEQAVATLGRWRQQRMMLPVAVNMSPIHFEQEGLKLKIQQLLERYQVPSSMLELEITEDTAMGDMEKGRNYVTELQQMGIRVSIDDFGTGYSSLGYLRKMPIDKIKIDRSFITDMAGSDSDMMIVKTMITLAHGLGKRILAEGVEDEHQLGLLRHMACDAVQGYLIAKPLPEAEALALLARKTSG